MYVHVLSDDVHVVGNLVLLVVTETTFMSMTIGEVRLVRNGDEVEAERAVCRVGQLEDNDDGRRGRRSLCSCLWISSSEE